MDRPNSNHWKPALIGVVAMGAVMAVLTWGMMGLSCDQDAGAIFRHTVTAPMGEGVKTALAGDPVAGLGQIVSAAIDGLVASIDQAGKPQTTE